MKQKLIWQTLWVVLLATPLVGYSSLYFRRPPLVNEEKVLFQGVTYQRMVRSAPRPHVIHTVAIDLQAPGIGILVTPGAPGDDGQEVVASTTSEFVQSSGVQLAVNANYFYPFAEDTPWRYFPHSGDRVNPIGEAISSGQRYAATRHTWPALCFDTDRQAEIVEYAVCPEGTDQAIAGELILVFDGVSVTKPQAKTTKGKPFTPYHYARAAIGLNAQGDKLWIVVIDGKQPFYSRGLTLAELADFFVTLGVDVAINLDGGGSTTLVMATPSGPKVLNAPIHTKLPMRERPVANHLGIYAAPQRKMGIENQR
ncbi:MAG: phosphodiester glycosidase family protein [Hormoscilla sp.]